MGRRRLELYANCEECFLHIVQRKPSGAVYRRRFCNRSCSSKTRMRLKPQRYWLGKKRFDMRGINNPMWTVNPKTDESKIARNQVPYKEWRKHVFQRDDYTCQSCKQRGTNLHAHHDLPFSKYPALRFEVLNGVTLCVPCHKRTDTYGGKISMTSTRATNLYP